MYKYEYEMCDEFIKNNSKYWDIYPECYGFDIFMFSKLDDVQIGVQAKMNENLKVIYQVLNSTEHNSRKLKKKGPHYRAILIPDYGNIMYEDICFRLAINVFRPKDKIISENTIGLPVFKMYSSCQVVPHNERYTKPDMKLIGKAGVSSPRNMSTWRIAAIKHFVEYEKKGYTTSSELKKFGLSPLLNYWEYKYLEPKIGRCYKLVLRNTDKTPITGYEKEYEEYKNSC